MSKLSSVQRRVLLEKLESPVKPDLPEQDAEAPNAEAETPDIQRIPPETPDKEINVGKLWSSIESLDQMASDMDTTGLFVAMEFSDFSTQKKLEAISNELKIVSKMLREKLIKVSANNPMMSDKIKKLLSGEPDEAQPTA